VCGYNYYRSSVRFSVHQGGYMPDPTWQALYRAALVESDPIKVNGRIEAARRAIRQRLAEVDDAGDTRERQQLDDALRSLFTLAARKRCA